MQAPELMAAELCFCITAGLKFAMQRTAIFWQDAWHTLCMIGLLPRHDSDSCCFGGLVQEAHIFGSNLQHHLLQFSSTGICLVHST